MTARTTLPSRSGPRTGIPPELLDALVDALVIPPDPPARSAVICTLIREMQSIVECLGSSETGRGRATEQEVTSMQLLAVAAHDHRLRVARGD